MTDKYKPIPCDLYDEYELAAVQGKRVRIFLKSGKEVCSVIKDLQTIDTIEYMFLSNGEQFRLDEIRDWEELKA